MWDSSGIELDICHRSQTVQQDGCLLSKGPELRLKDRARTHSVHLLYNCMAHLHGMTSLLGTRLTAFQEFALFGVSRSN